MDSQLEARKGGTVAGYFGPLERRRAGWVHTPSGASSGVALVVCNPFGYEWICAHRSLVAFADEAARRGGLGVRFDYDGTGDSFGDDTDPDRVGAWLRSVDDAIDLARASGATRIVLMGVRWGAALAATAASRRDDVDALCLVAPVVSGRAYARELKLLQAALALAPDPARPASDEAPDEALGFVLGSETRAAMGKVDLAKLPKTAPRVLVIDRDDMPATDGLAQHLRALGAQVAVERLPGYLEMTADPHKAVIPARMLDAVGELVAASAPSATEGVAIEAALAPTMTAAEGVVESPLVLEKRPAGGLFGILAEPAAGTSPARGRLGILLMNAGAVHHVGPNRLYVTLARRWAARGHVVLRLDVSGLGESAPRAGDAAGDVYTSRARQDATKALQALRERGAKKCVSAGICSGAYNSFKSASEALALDAIVAINPATFAWKEGMSLDVKKQPYGEDVVVREAKRYGQRMRDLESWKRLLRGQVKLDAVAQVMSRRLVGKARDVGLGLARRAGLRVAGDLGGELTSIAERNVDMTFVFAEEEPGLAMIRDKAGSVVQALERRKALSLVTIEGPDHTFTATWAQARLVSVLDGVLERLERA